MLVAVIKKPFLFSFIPACAMLIPFERASAIVHLWEISQVYSNEDGSVQYIELYVCCDGEHFTQGVEVVTHQDGGQNEQGFVIPENLDPDTANRHLLLATGTISGVEPDFEIPEQFIPHDFNESGTVDISNWAWASSPNRVDYVFIPADGFRSIDGHGEIQDPATVTNFSGDSATVTPPEPDEPPAAPDVTDLGRSGKTFSLAFTTEDGHTYTVEYINNLRGSEWAILDEIEGTGEVETVSDTSAETSRRFYRITAQ